MRKRFVEVRKKIKDIFDGLTTYIKDLLFPLYLFPIKLVTYTLYYIVLFLIRFIIAVFGLIFDTLIYPFRSMKHFLRSIIYTGIFLYLFASLFVIVDYLNNEYGYYGKFLCSIGTHERLKDSVVRVVGGRSEGSGFFVSENEILTNFHVIADEPSPKIIFPDGKFVTVTGMKGDRTADLAVLTIPEKHPDMMLSLMDKVQLSENEHLIASGYPFGTAVAGEVTRTEGKFVAFRYSRKSPVVYIHTTVNLADGMSGGPLTDQCGTVVGVNTSGIDGNSFFITMNTYNALKEGFTDADIAKIQLDPAASPEESVRAFYTYLKARRMMDGFNLLSTEYLKKTDFDEWTGRFNDILDVNIFLYEPFEKTDDTVFVKFTTQNWVENEVDTHYYEGTWQTVFEDGVYKMLKSKILEVEKPDYSWWYE